MFTPIQQLLQDAVEILHSSGIDNAMMESRWMMEDVTGTAATDILFSHSGKAAGLTPEQITQFNQYVEQRQKGIPLAYVLGHIPFHNIDVIVSPNVLIPRPETEEMVEICLNQIYKQPVGRLLDLCCGSGCIGISIGYELKQWEIDMSDFSSAAVEIARKNLSHNQIDTELNRFEIVQSDLFESIPTSKLYDVIITNPPYIFPDEKVKIDSAVREHEPDMALFHNDPVKLYASILKGALPRLLSSGFFLAELSERISGSILELARPLFRECEIIKDLSNKDRFLLCKFPGGSIR